MGWIATPQLVAASSNAGAFGFLAGAVMRPAELALAIAETAKATPHRFGVNFHSFQPSAAEIVEIILASRQRVGAVSFGRGPDADMIARFKAAGIVCIPTIGAVKHAQKMVALGCEALTVQGGEGGGHTGAVATSVLLPQVLDTVDVPVAAAGGFADGRGLAAALAWGADGVAMGSRFMMTADSPVPAGVKAAYRAADTGDISVTDKVDGIPQRMVRNAMLAQIERSGAFGKWGRGLAAAGAMKRTTGASWPTLLRSVRNMTAHGGSSLPETMLAAAAPVLLQRAVVSGDAEGGLMAAGQVVGRLVDLPSCADLLAEIETDARARLRAICGHDAQMLAGTA
jgi:NAD(P)H-dependent flavin oxidoreductase YrpB (nitropropane dioxygenase family)